MGTSIILALLCALLIGTGFGLIEKDFSKSVRMTTKIVICILLTIAFVGCCHHAFTHPRFEYTFDKIMMTILSGASCCIVGSFGYIATQLKQVFKAYRRNKTVNTKLHAKDYIDIISAIAAFIGYFVFVVLLTIKHNDLAYAIFISVFCSLSGYWVVKLLMYFPYFIIVWIRNLARDLCNWIKY